MKGVAERAPRTGKRVAQAKKRANSIAAKKAATIQEDSIEAVVPGASDSEDDELSEDKLQLQYNTVRGYVSAIQKLYDEQKTLGINPAPRLQGIALKALKQSILRSTWSRKRNEFTDCGEGTIKDLYLPSQIPNHTVSV